MITSQPKAVSQQPHFYTTILYYTYEQLILSSGVQELSKNNYRNRVQQ